MGNNRIIREMNRCKLMLTEVDTDEELRLLLCRIVELISYLEYEDELSTNTKPADRRNAKP